MAFSFRAVFVVVKKACHDDYRHNRQEDALSMWKPHKRRKKKQKKAQKKFFVVLLLLGPLPNKSVGRAAVRRRLLLCQQWLLSDSSSYLSFE